MKHFVVIVLLGGFVFPEIHAQDTKTQEPDSAKTYIIDEMVVTGTRSLKKIIDVPFSVARINNYEFRFEKKNSVNDALVATPGVFFQDRYGNHDVRISIRGFGSKSNSGIRGVRMLLDDIPESEPDGQTRIEAVDFHSLGRIEIVKGNASSLYTNAPGGVINFISDLDFTQSHVAQYNEFGSYDLHNNGMKVALKGDAYKFLTTYTYHTAKGYRPHSDDYWHIVNSVYQMQPAEHSTLGLYFYYVDGKIHLPGSLTAAQYALNPLMANPRDVGRDAKRLTKKSRYAIRYNTQFGSELNSEFEATLYGTTKYFERTAATYRLIYRNGFGASSRYIHRNKIATIPVEFVIGGDMFSQSGPIEEYNNIAGKRDDILVGITNETIANTGAYFQTTWGIVENKLDLLITGRYDDIQFISDNQLSAVKNSARSFSKFTPKAGLNYKITPAIALYTSYGLGFDTPAFNEMDNYPLSSNYPKTINPDLKPQQSKNFEIGTKANFFLDMNFFTKNYVEATYFNSVIQDEVVPFTIGSGVYYRNAAKTNRSGIELGVTTEILPRLQWKTAYTFSDFKYDTYASRVYNTAGDTIRDKNFSGKEVPSVPKHNFITSLSYERPITENLTGFVKSSFQYVSGMFANDENSVKSGGYQIATATIGTDLMLGKLNVLCSAGINNAFDKRYVAFININSDRKEFFETGQPRNFFASLNFAYSL